MSDITSTPVKAPAGRTSLTPALRAMRTESNPDRKPDFSYLSNISGGLFWDHEHSDDLDRYRLLTDECLKFGSSDSACFYADKACTLSRYEAEDIVRIAKCYAAKGSHLRAVNILEKFKLIKLENLEISVMATRSLIQAGKKEECLRILEKILGHGEASAENIINLAKKKNHASINPLSMLCCTYGKIFAENDNRVKSAVWLKAALMIDYKLVEAYELLISWHLLSSNEMIKFLEALPFTKNEKGLKELYKSKLGIDFAGSKIKESSFEYINSCGLGESLDVLSSKAKYFYSIYEDKKALSICKNILKRDSLVDEILPLYSVCLMQTGEKAQLFSSAHTLAEEQPDSPLALFCLGCYCMLIKRHEHAWKLFHKAAQQDPSQIYFWIGMGNAAAIQDDSDRAVGAYRAAIRICSSNHIPPLYIAMEYLRTNNLGLAQHFLEASKSLCLVPKDCFQSSSSICNSMEVNEDLELDPLLLNEMGVLSFKKGEFGAASIFFEASSKRFIGTMKEIALANLGLSLRKQGLVEEALNAYKLAVLYNSASASTLSAFGYLWHMLGNINQAVSCYHRALAIKPKDPLINELLDLAIEESCLEPIGNIGRG